MNSNLEIYEATSSKPLSVSSKNMGAHTMHTWLWQQDYVVRPKSSPTTHTFWPIMPASMYSPWDVLQRTQGWYGISHFVFRHKFRCRQGWVGRHSVKVEKPIPKFHLTGCFCHTFFHRQMLVYSMFSSNKCIMHTSRKVDKQWASISHLSKLVFLF